MHSEVAFLFFFIFKDWWKVRRCEDESGSEEELYVNEQTVVWSRGLPDATSSVLKSFTVDSPVQDVCPNSMETILRIYVLLVLK